MNSELECALEKFEFIRRRLTVLFYIVGFTEIVTSTTALLLHSLEGTNPTVKYPSLALEGIAIVFAAILVFVPLDGSRKSCASAVSSCSQFLNNPSQMPAVVYRQLSTVDTLWYTQPMSNCPILKSKMTKKINV